MSTTYLPVYSLSEASSPTTSDYFVTQSSATNGDVGLLPISTFLSTFIQAYITDDTLEIVDDTVQTLYEGMWWAT